MKGRLLLLLTLFVVSLGLPILAARSYFSDDKRAVSTETEIFPDAAYFARKDSHISLPDSPALNLQRNDRVLFVGWFKPRKLPREGEKLFLFSKLDAQSKNLTGYVFALTRKGDSVRPTVYWKDAQGKGGWYLFSKVDLVIGEWVMFGLSYYDNKILGAYSSVHRGGSISKPALAGGVDLEEEIIPANAANLIIGATEGLPFKGRVGPFCVLNLEEDSPGEMLKKFSKNPHELPEGMEKERIRFCSFDWQSDVGPFSLPIKYSEGQGADSDE